MLILRALNNRLFLRDLLQNRQNFFGHTASETQDMVAQLKSTYEGWFAGKIGTTELLALEFSHRWLRPSFLPAASWRRSARRLFVDSGVFPVERSQFDGFNRIFLEAIRQADGLYLWQKDPFLQVFEKAVVRQYAEKARPVNGEDLCYRIIHRIHDLRWLVISPFVHTMKQQLPKLAKIHGIQVGSSAFSNISQSCRFLACPQFSYLIPTPFSNWTDGLRRLTELALNETFDVALVGAGAWSLPLLANLKMAGKKGLHLGGETQLLFGIKGRRWDGMGLYNEHWVRPSPDETPSNFMKKENGCYW